MDDFFMYNGAPILKNKTRVGSRSKMYNEQLNSMPSASWH